MIVVVDLPEGSFVADPGLGGLGCRAPIPLDGAPAADGDETNRIVFDGRRRTLRSKAASATIDAWICGLDDDNWVDFEVANHWFSTHPASPMRQRLMLRAMIPDGRRDGDEPRRHDPPQRSGQRLPTRGPFGASPPAARGLRLRSARGETLRARPFRIGCERPRTDRWRFRFGSYLAIGPAIRAAAGEPNARRV